MTSMYPGMRGDRHDRPYGILRMMLGADRHRPLARAGRACARRRAGLRRALPDLRGSGSRAGAGHHRRPPARGLRARRAGRGGGTWLQYWLFHAGQDQDRGSVRTGRRRRLGDGAAARRRARTPAAGLYAQHPGAERCSGSTCAGAAAHPLVYAAHGSHASYLRPGVRDRTWPDPNDEADGRGRVVTPRLVRVDERSPRWMRWPGRWGGARARWWNPAEQDSPRGPAFQGQGRWSDPDAWARDARGCRADCDELGECDWRENALGGGLLAAVGLLGGTLRWRRRRRSREERAPAARTHGTGIIVSDHRNPRRARPAASGRLRAAERAVGRWTWLLVSKSRSCCSVPRSTRSSGRPSRRRRCPGRSLLAFVLRAARAADLRPVEDARRDARAVSPPRPRAAVLRRPAACGWRRSAGLVAGQRAARTRGVVDFHAPLEALGHRAPG